MLADLYNSVNGLFAFTFYSRYDIEPEDMFFFIEKYSSNGVLEYESDKLNLTKEGREIILRQLFHRAERGNKFLKIPPEFIVKKINVNEPYLPNIRSVSLEILKN